MTWLLAENCVVVRAVTQSEQVNSVPAEGQAAIIRGLWRGCSQAVCGAIQLVYFMSGLTDSMGFQEPMEKPWQFSVSWVVFRALLAVVWKQLFQQGPFLA